MRSSNNYDYVGGVFEDQTPSPCFHQYEKKKSHDGLTIYECYWCHHQLIKFGGGSKSFTDGLKPSLCGRKFN